MPEYFFRSACLDDCQAIAKLVNFVYRGESGARSWTGEAHLLDGQRTDDASVRDTLNDPQARMVLAFRNSELVGCVLISKEDDRCYLGMLTVHVDLQKAGLGSQLVMRAEQLAQEEWRCSSIFMHVISLRSELIDWYLRRGYVHTGKTAPFPYGQERFGIPKRNDLEFVILEKSL